MERLLIKKRSVGMFFEENIPSWVRSNQQWWYTHQKARKAYNLLARQVKKGTLFTFLDSLLLEKTSVPIS